MEKTQIAILAPGSDTDRARGIAEFFNDGNRIEVVAVISDPAGMEIPESVKWLVTDGDVVLTDALAERFAGCMIPLEEGVGVPECAAAIVAYIRGTSRPGEDPDEAWARTLGVEFRPEKVGNPTPPPVPEQPRPSPSPEGEWQRVQPGGSRNSQNSQNSYNSYNSYDRNRQNPQAPQEPMPPTYLVWAVLCTVLCCLPAGIVAIVFASQVSQKYFAGDIEGAKRSSRIAEIWIIVSFVIGVLWGTLYIPLTIAGWVG